jgi:hypothetical protein
MISVTLALKSLRFSKWKLKNYVEDILGAQDSKSLICSNIIENISS